MMHDGAHGFGFFHGWGMWLWPVLLGALVFAVFYLLKSKSDSDKKDK